MRSACDTPAVSGPQRSLSTRSVFACELAALRGDERGRAWRFVAYDQLTDQIGALAEHDPRELGIVLVECPAKVARRPYHKQKLALVLANLRSFALEQARRGVAVRHVVARAGYAEALGDLARELGPLRAWEPAERELRFELRPLVESGALVLEPHPGWLTTREQFLAACGPRPPWRMDAFYRNVRRASGVLMERGKPVGGAFSFDAENRKPWKGSPPAPEPPTFEPDAVTREVGELVERVFARHPGRVDLAQLPATRADAERILAWALDACLEHFGPFEDAMSTRSSGLFHTRLAPLINLHRLTPRDVLDAALEREAPLASREGFVRQVLGWREFVRHVHRETDGFRRLGVGAERNALQLHGAPGTLDSGAAPNFLDARTPLPPAYWGTSSGLACLDHVVADVWREGWSHHITRLMVLANIATLLDVDPRALTDWFWAAYVDAFDWVVEPNVLAMGTFATGDLMTTKPYVAGSAYIDRMSDYCSTCRFVPGETCPLTRLYWAWLARHADALERNPRLTMPLRSLAKRAAKERALDAAEFEHVRETLGRGAELEPRVGE